MHGFLNIDKPAGMTSHDVVARLRRVLGRRRIGHAGTLDPAATGVLVVGIGQATRLIEFVQDATTKRYLAEVRLGVSTTTDDAEGEVIRHVPVPALADEDIAASLAAFRGVLMQVPPMYAALHHEGRRLHELARAGVIVERTPRRVTIERLDLLAYDPPRIMLDIVCSKGTYIRSLARDIGAALGCGGHLQALRRTAVGAFTIEAAVPLAQIENPAAAAAWLIEPVQAVADWPLVTLDAALVALVRNGRPVALAAATHDRLRAHAEDGTLVALLQRDGEVWRSLKVLNWSES